jgi:hypothetical protein
MTESGVSAGSLIHRRWLSGPPLRRFVEMFNQVGFSVCDLTESKAED